MKRSLLLVCAGLVALALKPVFADEPAVPGEGFSASRYEVLWTKSPFAVATAEAVQESPDYILVGIAEFDGISYASLIERQPPQDHFLVSTDKPTQGMTLTSITRGQNGSDTYAVVQKDGQPITLKLEQAPAPTAPVGMPGSMGNMPNVMAPQLQMPGASPVIAPSTRPLIRFHRPPIHLPPMPTQQQPPPQTQAAPNPPQ